MKQSQSILLNKHAKLRADKENLEKALRQIMEERDQLKSESVGVHMDLDSPRNEQRSQTQFTTPTSLNPNKEISSNNPALLGGSYLVPQHSAPSCSPSSLAHPPLPAPPPSLQHMKRRATVEEPPSKRARLS